MNNHFRYFLNKEYSFNLCSVLFLLWISACGSGCNKFLDKAPQTSISPDDYFVNESSLAQYVNSFYSSVLPSGSDIYSGDNTSDNVDPGTIPTIMSSSQTVPSSASGAGWVWTDLRNINYLLEHYNQAKVDDSIKNNYAGIAKFFRAFFYFQKVQQFGDVPWYSNTLTDSSAYGLYKARDSRQLVMDSIISDLDFAANNITRAKDNAYVTKWAALALKSRVCLFEGTYRKYHTELNMESSAKDLLEKAADAANTVIVSGGYTLYTTGSPTTDYMNLFVQTSPSENEIILAREYSSSYNVTHTANGVFTTATLGTPGLTKSLVNSYLTIDGKPFSSRDGYATEELTDEVKNRDPRLAQTIRTPGYTRIGGTALLSPDFNNAKTGYQCIKFVTSASYDAYNSNVNAIPIIRLAEVMLNYAEARAELGELTQEDVAKSLNPIRKRVGMPDFDMVNVSDDPILDSQYTRTTNPLIMAIRRERRVELAMEGFRRQDMLRWKEGPTLAKTFLGTYFSGFGYRDFNGDGILDFGIFNSSSDVKTPSSSIQYVYLSSGYTLTNGNSGNLNIHPTQIRSFVEPRDYLLPLPTDELVLNAHLTQNPGW